MMGTSNATDWWAGDGGNSYLQRNRVDWRARIPFWKTVLDLTGARSVYEFGCNAGYNLSAIHRAYPDVACYGFDVNEEAAEQCARAFPTIAGISVGRDARPSYCGKIELVATAGVLIHVPPAELDSAMRYLIDQSARYVLAIEYEAEQEEEIEYRGERGLLWKRPYGHLYREMGLRFVASWPPETVVGFDRCTATLLEKP